MKAFAAQVVALLEDVCARRGGAEVLEAGCGRFRHFAYPSSMRIVGLDISPEQIARNDYAHETILGDVQTHRMDRRFDSVVSVFVLEHVPDPESALRNMRAWTSPGGLLILAVPNVYSLKGLVTKFTPFWFHHLVYRFVYRRPYEIFPTTMKTLIAPRSLRRFFARDELVIETYGEERLSGFFQPLYRAVLGVLRVLSLGRWRPERSNYFLVVRRAGD